MRVHSEAKMGLSLISCNRSRKTGAQDPIGQKNSAQLGAGIPKESTSPDVNLILRQPNPTPVGFGGVLELAAADAA
jgi:hypothetical protein